MLDKAREFVVVHRTIVGGIENAFRTGLVRDLPFLRYWQKLNGNGFGWETVPEPPQNQRTQMLLVAADSQVLRDAVQQADFFISGGQVVRQFFNFMFKAI